MGKNNLEGIHLTTQKIKIHTEDICLDQFLKKANVIASGGEIKFLLNEQKILLNGKIETARRRKLHAGDIVTIKNGKTQEILEVALEEVKEN